MRTSIGSGKACACAVILALAASTAQAWEPAQDMAAQQVLRDARQDASAGRLAEAAEKHLWFHQHVLEREPSMEGVRLSFAMHDWVALARRYPPAMAQLIAVRDSTVTRIDAGGMAGKQALNEVISINNYMHAPESTRDAFNRLLQRDPVVAERSTPDVLPALIELNDIELASKHLRVDEELNRVERFYGHIKALKSSLPADQVEDMKRWQQRHVDIQLARVAYVLCKDRREADAERVVARGRALLDPDASVHHMTEALRCIAPPNDGEG
ncbi:hypothetical protein [Roseateles sp.]|uniref:hypothetical protein n=1 Tax=Roseateles sp. TaxID=1971397 RepID=UPI0025D1F475|nr:hypothetical protein [Roseateles sp.]MBV8037864.1 hypothetical protein [Roseateles sp.]